MMPRTIASFASLSSAPLRAKVYPLHNDQCRSSISSFFSFFSFGRRVGNVLIEFAQLGNTMLCSLVCCIRPAILWVWSGWNSSWTIMCLVADNRRAHRSHLWQFGFFLCVVFARAYNYIIYRLCWGLREYLLLPIANCIYATIKRYKTERWFHGVGDLWKKRSISNTNKICLAIVDCVDALHRTWLLTCSFTGTKRQKRI